MKLRIVPQRTKRNNKTPIRNNNEGNQHIFSWYVQHVQRKYSVSVIMPVSSATGSVGGVQRRIVSVGVQRNGNTEIGEKIEKKTMRENCKLD
jgi:hypothetical protein